MVSELLLGPSQPAATQTRFSLLPRRSQLAFTGWDVSGWVRWLAGLRGAYERRMSRMARILDDGALQLKQSTPTRDDLADWGVVTKTRLYSFSWPMGGMFLWLRMHFESHPLWMAKGSSSAARGGRVVAHDVVAAGDDDGAPPRLPVVDGPALGVALMAFCIHKPYLVLAGPGAMFATNEEVKAESAWAYYRLCFAAVSEEEVDACSKRWVAAVHKFWRIKDVRVIEELVAEFNIAGTAGVGEDVGNLAGWGVGC